MLAILGALAFGVVATGAWISAEQREQKDRGDSLKNGTEFYFDKSGRMRHTGNRRRYTPEEIHKFYNPISLEEREKQWEEKYHDKHDPQYYVASKCHYYEFYEVFLTEEEAHKYIEDNYDEYVSDIFKKVYKISKFEVQLHLKTNLAHCNFDPKKEGIL